MPDSWFVAPPVQRSSEDGGSHNAPRRNHHKSYVVAWKVAHDCTTTRGSVYYGFSSGFQTDTAANHVIFGRFDIVSIEWLSATGGGGSMLTLDSRIQGP